MNAGFFMYSFACPHACSSTFCTRREYSKMPCDLISLALSLCLALAIDTLLSWRHLFSIYQILPILKNPRQVLFPPWNLCWLLHLPLTSPFTEQVPHFFKCLSHSLVINYILSCSLQRCLVSQADTVWIWKSVPCWFVWRWETLPLEKKEIKLISSFLLQFLFMNKEWFKWLWKTTRGRWQSHCYFTAGFYSHVFHKWSGSEEVSL